MLEKLQIPKQSYILIGSGYSTPTSSGPVSMRTPNAGGTGVSGEIMVTTGTSSSGNTGLLAKHW